MGQRVGLKADRLSCGAMHLAVIIWDRAAEERSQLCHVSVSEYDLVKP